MHKLVGITDRKGNLKEEELKEIENNYSLYGELRAFYFWIKAYFCFTYNNSEEKLESFKLVDDEYVEKDKLRIITTEDRIYYFKEVEDEGIEK